MAYVILWEFRPRPGQESEFEAVYGPQGEWARLFGRSPEYLGTELLLDAEDASRYLTVDRWISRVAYEEFQRTHLSEYRELDRRCEQLTSHEAPFGTFNTLES